MGKPETSAVVQLTEAYFRAAKNAGCPQDQIVNFYKAGVVLQPKQLEMSSAARKCDSRCADCEAKYKAGQDLPDECDKCGPTAVGVGGARGGAKTHWMFAQIACDDCQRYPGLKVLMLRKTAKSLREQLRDLLRKILTRTPHNYREQFGIVEFKNGSIIQIGHFKDESEIDNYLGQEYDVIAIEELTTLTFDKYKNIISCLRSSKPGWRPRLYAAWNWGGCGHAWVKDVFYTPYREKRERETRYVLATVADNKHVNPEYKKVLQSYTGWKYQSWFLGDPDFVAGQFFTNYKPDIHVFPNQSVTFDVSKVVRWFGSLDYGFKHPNCFLLHCQDSDGNYFTMREYHKAETLIQDHAEEFRDMLRLQNLDVDDLEFIAAGRDCFKVDKDGSTVATEYSKCGIELTPVHIDRVNAWSQCQERLGDVERGIRPTWYIHKSCENLISQIQVAEADEKKPGDVKKMDADEEGLGGDDALECCTGKTRVIVAGGEKLISEIKTGEKVLTRKGYRSVVRTITTANQKVFTVKFEDGPSLEATANHPIFIKTGDSDQWVKIQDLKAGMVGKGFSEDGYYCAMKIESISESGIADVYNLTVEDCPEYFANRILVHNCWRNSVVMERTSAVTDAKSVKTYRGITDIAATVVDQDDEQRLIPEWSEA